MPNPKFASAYAVHKNNYAGGGYIKKVGLHPHEEGKVETTDNEVDMLHKAVGGAIVDRIMKARDEAGPFADGGNQDGNSMEDMDENLSSTPNDNDDVEFSDDLDNQVDPASGEEEEEQEGGKVDLRTIMSSIRKRNMGRR